MDARYLSQIGINAIDAGCEDCKKSLDALDKFLDDVAQKGYKLTASDRFRINTETQIVLNPDINSAGRITHWHLVVAIPKI